MRAMAPIFPGHTYGGWHCTRGPAFQRRSDEGEPLRGCVTLVAIIRTLKRKYHWPIKTASFPSNAVKGGATWVAVYSEPLEVTATASEAGAQD